MKKRNIRIFGAIDIQDGYAPPPIQMTVPDEGQRPKEQTTALEMIGRRHPSYNYDELLLYRRTYERGDDFVQAYLRKHYFEDKDTWADRKNLTYNPAFAAEAVDEYVRAIVQRAPDISRVGGSKEYLQLVEGHNGGIDRQGSTMNAFMASKVTSELLAMGSVAIYVDNDVIAGKTIADARGKYPFIFRYRAEDILNWRHNPENPQELTAILLREYHEDMDYFGLTKGILVRYRHVMQEPDGRIIVRIFDDKGKMLKTTSQNTLFPVVLSSLAHSLLRVTSRYQIALLNLASSDLYYAWASNFPIYTEQYEPLAMDRLKETRDSEQDKPLPVAPIISTVGDEEDYGPSPEEVLASLPPGPATTEQKRIKVGTSHGRLYPKGTERPGFIHPSSDPLKISMEKEEQLKREMRQLTALAVTQLEPQKQASAESRAYDNLGLEAGMAFIAQELQSIEIKIAAIWHSYEKKRETTKVKYPDKYNLKSDEDRREEAKQLKELHQAVPSRAFQEEVSIMIALTLFKDKVTPERLEEMVKEIKKAPGLTSDPDILQADHESGAISNETYSLLRGYKSGEHVQAQKDHLERIKAVAEAQAAASNEARGTGVEDSKTDDLDKQGKQKRGPAGIKPKENE